MNKFNSEDQIDQSELEATIENLNKQIMVAIARGEVTLAQRKTNALEKLLKIKTQTPKTLSPIEALKKKREEKDRLMAELERRFERMRR